jgi:toxin ParE1/3/4
LLDRRETRCQQLCEQPRSGVARTDISADARHLVIGNFLVFYRLGNDEVVLLRILDGRRNITAGDLGS